MKDYIESFQIPLISPMIHESITDKDKGYYLDDTIDLVKKKFYKNALETYKKISKLKNEDGSDLSAYNLFLKNLEYIRGNYAPISATHIYNQFVNLKDIENVKRVLYLEKKVMDEKIDVLRKFINKLKKSKEKINKDL